MRDTVAQVSRLALALAVSVSAAASANAEVITGAYRAVTLEPGARRAFRVPGLERVTASSGRCIEEVIDSEEPDSFAVVGRCSAVRTSLVWRKDKTRIHVLACAEGDDRPASLVPLRKQLQTSLKDLPSAAACIRNGRVELHGWALSAQQMERLRRLEASETSGRVKNLVELISNEVPPTPL